MDSTTAVDALRDCLPNTRVTVTHAGRRYGTQVDARRIVKDFDSLSEDRDYWKAEALKWQRLAAALSEAVK